MLFSGVKEYLEANISSFTDFLFDLIRLVEWLSKLGVGGDWKKTIGVGGGDYLLSLSLSA